MSVFEALFNSAILEVAVPDTSVEFPEQSGADEWLSQVRSDKVERKQAFFGESLARTHLISKACFFAAEFL